MLMFFFFLYIIKQTNIATSVSGQVGRDTNSDTCGDLNKLEFLTINIASNCGSQLANKPWLVCRFGIRHNIKLALKKHNLAYFYVQIRHTCICCRNNKLLLFRNWFLRDSIKWFK